jgi:hypothetical protein
MMTRGWLSKRLRNVATRARTRCLLATLGLGLVASLWTGVAHALAPAASEVRADSARLLKVDDSGHLHLLHAYGEVIEEEGKVSGTLRGTVFVHMTVGAANVTATFTIRSEGGGSIEGHGQAVLHSSGLYSSFRGTLSVGHGTGRYAHAHGTGKLYGTIERTTEKHLTVQTSGSLDY